MNISRCELCGGDSMDYDASICGRCVSDILAHKTAVMAAANIAPAILPGPTLSQCCGKPESVMPLSALGETPMVLQCDHCGATSTLEFL